ncbi:helix-turn-helix domain-containing protein [Sphingomonas lacusdianchii]|uniref:helix-turn-helix domain-containing protein n=1 Tax=Sphingomonas lacusdianchii TaxID=2917992 RepID=UPI001F570559
MQIEVIREVGERIRKRRMAAGLSQAELAARSDLDRLYLGRLERGSQNPTLLVIARLSVELEYPLGELFAGLAVSAKEVRAVRRLSRGPGRRGADDGEGSEGD